MYFPTIAVLQNIVIIKINFVRKKITYVPLVFRVLGMEVWKY